jgi:tryptophan synthase alpha chain
VRAQTDKPLAVGFGISTPEQAAAVGEIADGVIVGSALIKAAGQADEPVGAAGEFVKTLKDALK